jgi:hypothetical protein
MLTQKQLEAYIADEKKDHGSTWTWVVDYVLKNGCAPDEKTFYGLIVSDELAANPDAYKDVKVEEDEYDIPMDSPEVLIFKSIKGE